MISSAGKDNSERREKDNFFPPNYASFILFFKIVTKAFLIILGLGKCQCFFHWFAQSVPISFLHLMSKLAS